MGEWPTILVLSLVVLTHNLLRIQKVTIFFSMVGVTLTTSRDAKVNDILSMGGVSPTISYVCRRY